MPYFKILSDRIVITNSNENDSAKSLAAAFEELQQVNQNQ